MQTAVHDLNKGLVHRKAICAAYQSDLEDAETRWAKTLIELRTYGHAALPGFIPREAALAMGAELDRMCREGMNLAAPCDMTTVTDLMDWRQGRRFTPEEVRRGEDWLRERTNFLQVDEPLVRFPGLARVGLDERILDIAGAYLGALPSLGFIKFRKTLVNPLPRFNTQIWHVDGNSIAILKAFLLLGDVDAETGPTEYVLGSHGSARDLELDVEGRWSHEEILEMFGQERLAYHIGQAGDLFLTDTTGFHRAGDPTKADRKIAIFNYVLHPEYGYEAANRAVARIGRSAWDSLTEKQRMAADQLQVVD